MGDQVTPDPDPQELLARTLRDPFADVHATHVRDWFTHLIDHFPLWAFQPREYVRLHPSTLPTYPLGRFVESILTDEGLKPPEQRFLESLPATLDRRRYGMAKERIEVAQWIGGEDDEPLRLSPVYSRFLPEAVTDLTFHEREYEHTLGGIVSPYDDIGRDLVTHVDDQRFARDKEERGHAKRAWKLFQKAIGALLPSIRPTGMPPDELMKELTRQGAELLELCWHFQTAISPATREVFVAEGVREEAEMELWSARLAMPFLSGPEILTLRAHAEEAGSWREHERESRKTKSGRPTPKRLARWVLAHRLQIPARRIARRFSGRGESDHFKVPNPIEGFLPFP